MYLPMKGMASPDLKLSYGSSLKSEVDKKSYINASKIELININKPYQFPSLWEDKSGDDLWFYNIHYFYYINNSEVDNKLKYSLMGNWIDNVSYSSAGWQAYPTSLRIVNWIKWIIKNRVAEQKILQSLYSQCCHLDKNIERHILANHLFSNIKAMLIAGLFFDSVKSIRWVNKYTAMLLREIKVQILENGGHYELSPMYHNIILEDLLDIISFKRAFLESAKAHKDLISFDELIEVSKVSVELANRS